MTENTLDAQHSLWLSRLRRCERWTEMRRTDIEVTLTGLRGKAIETQVVPRDVLTDLLKVGLVSCESSPRIEPKGKGLIEVLVKYWSVAGD